MHIIWNYLINNFTDSIVKDIYLDSDRILKIN